MMANQNHPPTGGDTRTPRYALGMILMLVDAIQRHRDAHAGARPNMLCMHPNLRGDLRSELWDAYGMRLDTRGDGSAKFEGVPIIWQERAIYPYAVSSTGTLYFL